MGAAGLTCSTSEMGARAGTGIEIDIARVPKRETGMTAYEVMLSESQERMLLVAERGREREVVRRLREVGPARGGHRRRHRATAACASSTTGSWRRTSPRPRSPTRRRCTSGPGCSRATRPRRRTSPAWPRPPISASALLALLAAPNIASKRWVYRQYDSTVRTNTLVGPGSDAAVVRVKGTRRALAMSARRQRPLLLAGPEEGAQLAVAEACRNVACAGAVPIGATNCLNFGNPEKPEVMGQIVARDPRHRRRLRAPWARPSPGGNVSLYNETDGRPIFPTPVLAVVGLIEDASRVLRRSFVADGDLVYLLGETGDDIGGSEYLKTIHGRIAGRPPKLDLDAERRLHALLAEGAAKGVLLSAHDASDGGIGVALAECCFAGEEPGRGARIELAARPARRRACCSRRRRRARW